MSAEAYWSSPAGVRARAFAAEIRIARRARIAEIYASFGNALRRPDGGLPLTWADDQMHVRLWLEDGMPLDACYVGEAAARRVGVALAAEYVALLLADIQADADA